MGGSYETQVESAPVTKGGTTTLGDIRVHEKDGEVHFHADSSGLKVAVPCAVWFKAWDRLNQELGIWSFVDHERGTNLTVEMEFDPMLDKPVVDVRFEIKEVELSANFKALHKFTTRKR